MAFVQEKRIKGKSYIYLGKTIRIGKKVVKLDKFLGKKSEISKSKLDRERKKFAIQIDFKIISLLIKQAIKKYNNIQYPINKEEIRKIEEMNFKYTQIKKSLTKKDWEDIRKRFIANFVFESNALEGNSLTLRNFTEIIFEDRIDYSANLREVYDAQNSYKTFSKLFSTRAEITESFIINIHKRVMKNIDKRTGYKKLPNVLLGRKIELTPPDKVGEEIKKLLLWYQKHKKTTHPLELAFKFHHKFELVHPFADGNGRVGRMLLNYILIRQGYYPIIIRKTQRTKYLKALQAADIDKYVPLMRFALEKAKDTYRKFFEVYYTYLPNRL